MRDCVAVPILLIVCGAYGCIGRTDHRTFHETDTSGDGQASAGGDRTGAGDSTPSCTDDEQNQDETGVDCGGVCPAGCANGTPCVVPSDCTTNYCDLASVCSTPDPPHGLTYGRSWIGLLVGAQAPEYVPSVRGVVDQFLVAPPLPAGLEFDGATGTISGVPTGAVDEQLFTVTAANAGGPTQTELRIAILDGYVVDVPTDGDDADLGDSMCDTSTTDGNPGTPCTLRAAVQQLEADGGGIAVLASETHGLTLGQITVNADLYIVGAGPGASPTTIDGGAAGRVLKLQGAGMEVHISDVTITNGNDQSGAGAELLDGVTVYFSNVVVTNNTATNWGGGGILLSDAGINTLFLEYSQVTSNTSTGPTNGPGGGILISGSVAQIDFCDISANQATGHGGGIVVTDAAVTTVTRSLVSGNTADGPGGGLSSRYDAKLVITNSTIHGNSAGELGGGIEANFGGDVEINGVTIVANHADMSGGALFFREVGSSLTVTNTIIADNTSLSPVDDACRPSSGAIMLSGGGNLLDVPDSDCGLTTGDIIGFEPGLAGVLQKNGGPTATMELLPTGAAVDAGSDANCTAVDQRGEPRPRDGNGDLVSQCDIGAFEVQ